MREIKFRAWDKEENKMFFVNKILWREDYGDITRLRLSGHKHMSHTTIEDKVLMQFTGLFDKNNREIYEGDILRYDLGDREAELEGEENRYCYSYIGHKNGSFVVIEKKFNSEELLSDFIKPSMPWEIIGNIYKNKELI